MTKVLLSLLCIFQIGMLVGCGGGKQNPNVKPGPNGDKLPVRIRVKKNAPDCDVDYEAVNVHTSASDMDTIEWCVKGGDGNTTYYIHFLDNSGNGSPVGPDSNHATNDIPVSKTQCSGELQPVAGKPVLPSGYDYAINIGSSTGPPCSDPKVILK